MKEKGNKLCILMMICDHFDPSTTFSIEFSEAFRTCGKSTVQHTENHHLKLHFSRLPRSLDTVIRQSGSCNYQANINKKTDKMPVDTPKCLKFDNPVTLKEFTST